MRLVALDQISGTEVLGKAIFDLDGRKLLNSGVSLRPAIIQKLFEKGISSIYIDDDLSEGIEVDSLLREETKTHASRSYVKKCKAIQRIHLTISNSAG